MSEVYSVARKFSGNIDNFHIISLSDARNFTGNIDTFQNQNPNYIFVDARKFTTKSTRRIIYKSLTPYILKMPVKNNLELKKLS